MNVQIKPVFSFKPTIHLIPITNKIFLGENLRGNIFILNAIKQLIYVQTNVKLGVMIQSYFVCFYFKNIT